MMFPRLRSLLALAFAAISTTFARADEAMPVLEYPVLNPQTGAPLIVLVSGDGGWAEIDQQLSKRWQQRGWPVVGINALKYFWKKRTPEVFAADLSAVVQRYQVKWGARPLVLAGFSFGAVVVPFAGNRLPPTVRETLAAMVLISPTEHSDWEVSVSSWLGGGDLGPLVEPELKALAPLPTFVLTGAQDPDAYHDWGERPGLRHEMWPGDHHLNRPYDRIDDAIAQFWKSTVNP